MKGKPDLLGRYVFPILRFPLVETYKPPPMIALGEGVEESQEVVLVHFFREG